MLNAIFNVVGGPSVGGDPGESGFILLQLDGQDPADMENVRRFVREFRGKPVMLVTGEFRQEPNLVGEFLEVCCDKDPQVLVSARDLYEGFKRWCIKEKGFQERHVHSARSLSADLRNRGFDGRLRLRCGTYVKGLGLKPEWRAGGAA
jgi:hypothetical protein